MIKVTYLAALMLLSSTTYAACVKPAAPTLPDADTAVTAQMLKAKNDVNEYIKNANAYLGCVKSGAKHNKMVKSMKSVGNEFNESVRSYKERMKDE